MATYFNKYYFEFDDDHVTEPARWRVDILDSEGDVPTTPFLLIPGESPIITERINTSDRKDIYVIGRQITISYKYTDQPNIPLPSIFTEGTERRFRVEVRKNGAIDGIYFVKPDESQFPDDFDNYTVEIKAIDGLGYAEGVDFHIWDDTGLIIYGHISIYEAIMTRALNKILDVGTIINVLCSLVPGNMSFLEKLLFGVYCHTDIFYDFVKGPVSILDVLDAFGRALYGRFFIAQGQVWFVRTQDLTAPTFTVDQYTDDSTVNEVETQFILTGGADPSSNDVTPIDSVPNRRMQSATKKATFKVEYQGINRLANFDWRSFTAFGPEFWGSVEGNEQRGTGTINDPYRVFLPYNSLNPGGENLLQISSFGVLTTGDTISLSFSWKVINVEGFRVRVYIQGVNPGAVASLDSSGNWSVGVTSTFIDIKRTKKKQLGSVNIQSAAIPRLALDNTIFDYRIEIYTPNPLTSPSNQDGPDLPGVEIYPIKLGISSSSSTSRVFKIVNNADFTKVQEEQDISFFDSGDAFLANTLFIDNFSTFEPASGWDSAKTGVNPADLERHMAQAHIDQYQRSVLTWEGALYSNSLEFYHLIEFSHLPGKRFMQLSDEYDNKTCTHRVLLAEVFDEGSAETTYTEYDDQDETDE